MHINKTLWIAVLLSLLLSSCRFFTPEEFAEEELMWYKPFTQTQTVIYVSDNNEADTIIFSQTAASSQKVRDIERGFYNTNCLTVAYNFTAGSYHQFSMMSDGKTRADQDILSLCKSSAGFGSRSIVFIGSYFNKEEIETITWLSPHTYLFKSENARYKGMWVNEEIKDFTFSTQTGIVAYTDVRGIKWKRK